MFKLESKGWFWIGGPRSCNVNGVMAIMAKAHARHANFLLTVGPDKAGKIIASSVKTLAEIVKVLQDSKVESEA